MGRTHDGTRCGLRGGAGHTGRLLFLILLYTMIVSFSLFGQTVSPPTGIEQNVGDPSDGSSKGQSEGQSESQSKGNPFLNDPSVLVGATLDGIFSRFGIPQSVHTVRGLEPWQDDVVFTYPDWDLYWYKDRVWQVGLAAAYGVKKGDALDTILSTLGKPVQQRGNTLVYSLPSRSWPLRMRVLLDEAGALQALYIFRSDF